MRANPHALSLRHARGRLADTARAGERPTTTSPMRSSRCVRRSSTPKGRAARRHTATPPSRSARAPSGYRASPAAIPRERCDGALAERGDSLNPRPQRRLGQIEVFGHLTDAPVTHLAEPHRLRLELRRELPALPRHRDPLLPHHRASWGVHEGGGGSDGPLASPHMLNTISADGQHGHPSKGTAIGLSPPHTQADVPPPHVQFTPK